MSTGILIGTPCFRQFDACHALPLRLLSFNVTKFLVKSLRDEQMDTPLTKSGSRESGGPCNDTVVFQLSSFKNLMWK